MEKYEKKVVKRIYKILKNDITQFRFGMPNIFNLSIFNTDFEHKKIHSKQGEIKINFEDGIIESPIYVELKGKYKKKIISLIAEYYHEQREEFAKKKIEAVENYDTDFESMVGNNNLDNLFTKDNNEEEDD